MQVRWAMSNDEESCEVRGQDEDIQGDEEVQGLTKEQLRKMGKYEKGL